MGELFAENGQALLYFAHNELRSFGFCREYRCDRTDDHIPDVAIKQTPQRWSGLLAIECYWSQLDRRFTDFRLQSLRVAHGGLLGSNKLRWNL